MKRLILGVGALVVLVALLVGAPLALATWWGNPWPAGGWAEVQLLTNDTIVGAIVAVGWLAWAQMTLCILIEAAAAVRGATAGRFRFAPAGQQEFARFLVTSVAALGLGASTVTAGATAISMPTEAAAHATTLIPMTPTSDDRDRAADASPGTSVTVEASTTAWRLAETHLGDGSRWKEILDVNHGTRLADGTVFSRGTQTIPAGTSLRLPAGATGIASTGPVEHAGSHQAIQKRDPADRGYTVKQDDTLWDIAAAELGDPYRYMELFEASKDTDQPHGEHLTDPDLIRPGWTITIPGTGSGEHSGQGGETTQEPPFGQDAPEPNQQTDRLPQHVPGEQAEQRAGGRHRVDHARTPGARGAAVPRELDQVQAAAAATEQPDDTGEVTALRALLASALCLSVGALGLVAANRRRQFRRRRIGRTIAATPDELVEVEQAIVENGSEAQEDVEFLDRALRHVAASCKIAGSPLPQLGAAVLGEEDLTLLFTHPAVGEVPEGWTATGDARAWMLPRWTFLEQDLETQPAPYPALVSVGLDEGRRTWLLDLETLGMCGVGGEPQRVADLARFMVAELAVNAWSEGSEVLLADRFGAETLGLNPARLRQVERSDALVRAAVLTGEMGEAEQNLGADVLTRRRDGLVLDTTNPVVVVVSSRPEGEFVADIEGRERSRVVVVHGGEESPAVELSADGMAFLPMWGIRVRPFTLPASEAQTMAALLASTRNLEDQPMPAPESDDGPLGKYALADGSLRTEYTEPRHTEGGDPSSLLPDADEVYLATAATTAEDLAAAAPSVPEETRAEIEALDPTLEEDLADWFDESSPRPKVRLLGPVNVTARDGGDPRVLTNLPGTISFIAYLACQDRGVTGERAAEACGWQTQRTVQNRATNARFLLGTRPDGSDWLPDATASDGARRGTPTYELVGGTGGVLVDFDLFKRLHFRAQKRGAEGCEHDLVTALSLVDGAPFEGGTDRRFPWVFKGQRYDDIMVSAIEKVAHVLATRAVAEGRIDLVRLACDAARKANPHSDVTWLDQAAAAEAESGRAAADELVREHIVDRFDEDLPPRTEAVLDQRDWAAG